MTTIRRRTAFTRAEMAALLATGVMLLGLAIPTLGELRDDSMVGQSLANLNALAVGHFIYAADHQGRQPTWAIDDLSLYGNDPFNAVTAYNNFVDCDDQICGHPPLLLGWAVDEDTGFAGLWAYWFGEFAGAAPVIIPINMDGSAAGFGSFRFSNAKAFHDYVSGKVYSPEFFAPADQPMYDAVAPGFDNPNEFVPRLVGGTDYIGYSSYCLSPAAMFHPDVMRHPDDGGWQDPFSLPDGLESPRYAEALYPNLKTLMLEHSWLQNAPAENCNPGIDEPLVGDCEPYYFNHGFASAPATLFHDGSTRLLPNTEAYAADQQLIDQTGHGLWSRDTPFGEDGYFLEYAYVNTQLSHHILTTDGIRGRDTLGPIPARRMMASPDGAGPNGNRR